MGNSKHRKNHKKKVAAFKKRSDEDKKRTAKLQHQLIMKLIEQEKNKGLFSQNSPIDGPIIDGPNIDGPIIDGPIIDGPSID